MTPKQFLDEVAGEKARMALKNPADLRLAVNPFIGV